LLSVPVNVRYFRAFNVATACSVTRRCDGCDNICADASAAAVIFWVFAVDRHDDDNDSNGGGGAQTPFSSNFGDDDDDEGDENDIDVIGFDDSTAGAD
jgi:hypothetical protein